MSTGVSSPELPTQPEPIVFQPLEQHPLQEVLPPDKRIIMQYGDHVLGSKDFYNMLFDNIRGKSSRTAWNLGDEIFTNRALNKPWGQRALGDVELFATDGANPMVFEKESTRKFLAAVNDPNQGDGESIKQMCKDYNIPEDEIDQVLEALVMHWQLLPFSPAFSKNEHLLLLRGDAGEFPGVPRQTSMTLMDEPSGLNVYEQDKKFQKQAEATMLASCAGSVAALVTSIIDTRSRKPIRPNRRNFLKGTAGLFGLAATTSGHQWNTMTSKLEASEEAAWTKDSDLANQAVARFDAAAKMALKNAIPKEHNVFRTLLLLTKTEEALRRKDLGLTDQSLAGIVMGGAHLWDRQYTAEMNDPKKRLQFIRNHVKGVILPVLDTALSQTPGKVDRNQAIADLNDYLASVDITKIKTPDAKRFPRSLLDPGIISPVASFQSPTIIQALR